MATWLTERSCALGLEAPRNSLDLPSYDNTMTVRQRPSKGSTPQERTTAKNVINEDFPSQPSVIARLMGIDTIPVPAKDAVMIHAEETSNLKLPGTMEINVTPPYFISYRSGSGDYRHCVKKMRPRRARSRQHHPQEDFQACQTSKALENSRTVADLHRYIQMLAQGKDGKIWLRKWKHDCNGTEDTLKNVTDESATDSATKAAAACLNLKLAVIKVLRVSHCAASERLRDLDDESNHSTSAKSCSLVRIVILKPSSDIGANEQESLSSSSKVKREGNMQSFLKERLKKELKVRFFAEDNVGRGRHGNSDAVSEGAAVARKNSSSFSLRGTVSNLRHSFSSRDNRLFGRKTHWSKKPSLGEFHPQMMANSMTPSPPETFNLLTVAQATFS
ncbi:hypothetical protein ABZP36_021813 [Zizania latifolia]